MKTIMEMALESGFIYPGMVDKALERFAELVRADEREACAKVVEDTLEPWLINEYIDKTTDAIRARGQA